MNILVSMPSGFGFITGMLSSLGLLWALWNAPWRELFRVPHRQHLWYFAIIFLALFWLLNVKVSGVFALHPLFIASLTLVFGWSLAVIGGAMALLLWHLMAHVLSFYEISLWANFLADHLLSVVIPATVSFLVMRRVGTLKYKNIFHYIFGVSFFGSAAGIITMCGFTLLLFYGFAAETQWDVLYQNKIYVLFLVIPEAAINGIVMTVFVVLTPDIVKTYDDRVYLDNADAE